MTPQSILAATADALESASFLCKGAATGTDTPNAVFDAIDGDGWAFRIELGVAVGRMRLTRPDQTPYPPDIIPEMFTSLPDLVGMLSFIKDKVLPKVRALKSHQPRCPKGGVIAETPHTTRLLWTTFDSLEPKHLHIHDKDRQWSSRRAPYANSMTVFAMQGEWTVLAPWPNNTTTIISPSPSQRASNGPRLNVGTNLIQHLEHIAEVALDSVP